MELISSSERSERLSYDQLLAHLEVPDVALHDLLENGDASFPAVQGNPREHKYTKGEVEQLEKFKEVLYLPTSTFTDEEIETASATLKGEGPLDFSDGG